VMCVCSVRRTCSGGSGPHTRSTKTYTGTTRPASTASAANTVRCRGGPTSTRVDPAHTSTGPNSPKPTTAQTNRGPILIRQRNGETRTPVTNSGSRPTICRNMSRGHRLPTHDLPVPTVRSAPAAQTARLANSALGLRSVTLGLGRMP
jgi:hypothetical protein